MGSDETAITIPGGPRVIDVFDGNGCHRAQIAHFFRGQIGSWRPLGVGLVVSKRLYRIRRRCGGLVLSESPGSHCQVIHAIPPWLAERNRPKMLDAGAYAP